MTRIVNSKSILYGMNKIVNNACAGMGLIYIALLVADSKNLPVFCDAFVIFFQDCKIT